MLCVKLVLFNVVAARTPIISSENKFGIGIYESPSFSTAQQLPVALDLVGQGGHVLVYTGLTFAENGNLSSCLRGCVPSEQDVAAIKQAFALGLRPVVRIGQWPRTIRDFSDDTDHLVYTSLARVYRHFVAALPLPPDGQSSLDVIVMNEPNAEWQCSGGGRISTNQTAGEIAGCLRDILVGLRQLPRLRLSAAPTAYASPLLYPCLGNTNGSHSPVNYSQPNDIAFMRQMLSAVPDLYSHVDFFNSHPYPFGDRPFSEPLGRAGAVHYRDQLLETGYPSLPVLISEAGWKGHDELSKATSIVAAFEEEWLPDSRVEGVTPFLLSAGGNTSYFANEGWDWVLWPNTSAPAPTTLTMQYNSTRSLRCRIGVGGACT
jgi:hypothetical protein